MSTTLLRTARALALVTAASVAGLGLLPATVASADTSPGLPPIHHVWQIQLENEEESATYMPCGTAGLTDPYLNCTLVPQGMYLQNYYSTGHVSLDNYLSETAGVPGNADTLSDCQLYMDFTGVAYVPAPSTGGTTAGVGCVYPTSVTTFEDQLTSAGDTWQGLMEDMGWDPSRETTTCGIPATSGVADNPATPTEDDTQDAEAQDQYAARHNPFAYFLSLDDSGACAKDVVPLGTPSSPLSGLETSLQDPANFTWITPDLCDDGHDSPCKGPDLVQELAGAPDTVTAPTTVGAGGLTSADRFLSVVVPMIEASPAYKAGGLIEISFDEGSDTDTSSCCGEVPGTTGVEPVGGGGLTGLLLISPLIKPGVSTVDYNHYSLLASNENLFGISTHLDEAAIAPAFGSDVYGTASVAPTGLPEVGRPVLYAAPLAGLAWAGVAIRRRRRHHRRA
jgi:hypothetical protein